MRLLLYSFNHFFVTINLLFLQNANNIFIMKYNFKFNFSGSIILLSLLATDIFTASMCGLSSLILPFVLSISGRCRSDGTSIYLSVFFHSS